MQFILAGAALIILFPIAVKLFLFLVSYPPLLFAACALAVYLWVAG
jgi:hypothetical protein